MSLKITIIESNQVVGELDVFDTTLFPFALTIGIADISTAFRRGGGTTKTFKVPATKNNNALLKHYYIISSDSDAAFNLTAQVSFNGTIIEEGTLKVKESFSDGNPSEYDLIFISNNNTWQDLLELIKIRDLEFNNPAATPAKQGSAASGSWNIPASSSGVFTHDQAHMEGSWFGTYDTDWDYVYSLKSFGQPTGFISGGAYVRPNDMRPDIYVRSIIREAFKSIGWTVESTFFDSTGFKKLVIPCTGDFLHKNKQYTYSIIDLPVTIALNLTQSLPLGGTLFNPAGLYLAQNNGTDQLNLIQDNFIDPNNPLFTQNVAQRLIITSNVTMNATIDFAFSAGSGSAQIRTANVDGNIKDNFNVTSGVPVELELEENDYIVFYLQSPNAGTCSQYDITLDVTKGEVLVNVGESYNVGYTLPEATALDFLDGIFQLFNIYFWADTGLRKVFAEPRNSFFTANSTALDWTSKIDVNSLFIKSNSTYKQELHFDFKKDSKDGYLSAVNQNQEKPVGSFWYRINEVLNRGISKFQNKIFSYTDNFFDTMITPVNTIGVRIPRLWKEAEAQPEKSFNFNLRILYFDGYLNQGVFWFWAGDTNQLAFVPYTRTDKDTFDLSFDGGLVDTYYKNTIGTIDNNRLLSCRAYLTPTDMNTLDFRTPIYITINNITGYYYLNKVIDYKPNVTQLTAIELIPVITLSQIVEANIIVGVILNKDAHGVGIFSEVGKRPGTVLKNNTGNHALNGSVALGINLIAIGEEQTALGRYNVDNSTDIFQVGIGTITERYRGLTIDQNGQFDIHGGKIYTTEGIPVMYATLRDTDGEPTNIQETYLNGDG